MSNGHTCSLNILLFIHWFTCLGQGSVLQILSLLLSPSSASLTLGVVVVYLVPLVMYQLLQYICTTKDWGKYSWNRFQSIHVYFISSIQILACPFFLSQFISISSSILSCGFQAWTSVLKTPSLQRLCNQFTQLPKVKYLYNHRHTQHGCACMCTHVHIHIHTYIHTHICSYTY